MGEVIAVRGTGGQADYRMPGMHPGDQLMARDEVTVDVLVVGTGASGMATTVTAAARGLTVLVVEKSARSGGTTARSGGWLWIPGTRLATEQGIHEPPGAARAYLIERALCVGHGRRCVHRRPRPTHPISRSECDGVLIKHCLHLPRTARP
jgi:glycerol-3-phosphate dehydrogenase